MASTFLGLNTAGTGMTYFQAALNTTAHNISNQNTEGYSRQQVLAQASVALRMHNSYGMQGTGITVTGVQQIRNAYYDAKYTAAMAKSQEYSIKNQYLLEMETYMNEQNSNAGYTKIFTEISAAMQQLSTNPSDSTTRIQYIQSLSNLTEYINELSNNYQITQKSANDEIAIYVNQINSLSKQIYSLNEQIVNIEVRGGNANDLRDQRALAVDKLSQIVNVTVDEEAITYGTGKDAVESGASRFTVRINGEVLVDDMGYNQLDVVPRAEKVNQTDIKGLYDVYWIGKDKKPIEKFNLNDPNLTGKLKGLYEIRDGNNNVNPLSGSVSGRMYDSVTNTMSITIKLDNPAKVLDINLPDSGSVVVGGVTYYYESWSGKSNSDGEINSISFTNLRYYDSNGKLVQADPGDFSSSMTAKVAGDHVDFKGIPYYMSQLNEFARTFSQYMNSIHASTDGADANNNRGLDILTTLSPDGDNYNFSDTTGTVAEYYRINCLNWKVNTDIAKDVNKVVVSYASDVEQGNVEANDIILKMMAGLNDRTMFSQGTASQFMEAITTNLAVDTKMNGMFSENQDDIVNVINNQRMSVSSVDQNEEANNLVILQNGYNLSCKVLSVLDEVLDKLINGTAV